MQRPILTMSGNSRDALASLKAALERNPEQEAAWLAYANGLAAHGEVATALALLDVARQRGIVSATIPALAKTLRDRLTANQFHAQATRHHQDRQLGQAITLYEQALALWPAFVEAQINLASALQETGAVARAADLLRRAIAQRPDFSIAHYNLGNVLAGLGQDPRLCRCLVQSRHGAGRGG
jgi:tetratricopeptide (TPR) repeat protein